MRLSNIERFPTGDVYVRGVARGGERVLMCIESWSCVADALPHGYHGLIATSDLQGIGLAGGLAGVQVAEHAAMVVRQELTGGPQCWGVLLAGDLFAHADRRGGLGDPLTVWQAFAVRFGWVVGVAGNHDEIQPEGVATIANELDGAHLLDASRATVGGFSVNGVSGVIGKAERPWRRSAGDYTAAVESQARATTNVLLLHQGPSLRGVDVDPHAALTRDAILRGYAARTGSNAPMVVICGHRASDQPLDHLDDNLQRLVVHERIVFIRGN